MERPDAGHFRRGSTGPLPLAREWERGPGGEGRNLSHGRRAQRQLPPHPLGFGQWLQALSYTLAKPREIGIVGDPDSADTQALLRIACNGYRPFQVVALGAPGPQGVQVPVLEDRDLVDGQAAAYVCRDFTCQAPVTEPEALRAPLEP